MTELQRRLTIVKFLNDLGLHFSATLTIYRPNITDAYTFFETFGVTEQRWIPCSVNNFRSVEVGKHILVYLDEHQEEIVHHADVDAPVLRDPVGAISLAYSFFGPEQVGNLEGAFKILVHGATAEQAVQIMQLFDAEVEANTSEDGEKWLDYGPVSIFFNKSESAEAVCPA